ncbi:unnamed protein product [Lathyrus sativus]|nr:unnamed protein product [Lathyrus sativus]
MSCHPFSFSHITSQSFTFPLSFFSLLLPQNEEDGDGYDVSGDFTTICDISVVDLGKKRGLELYFKILACGIRHSP